MKPTDADITSLKSKHTDLHLLEYDDGKNAVVAKRPPPAEWRRLGEDSVKDKGAKAAHALGVFARSCIVWPDADALDAILEERPALLERWGDKLCDIVGAAEKITAKKL